MLQEHNLCLPTCGAMVLNYYGEQTSQYSVKHLCGDDAGLLTGTRFTDLIKAVRVLGYKWRAVAVDARDSLCASCMNVLKKELDAGRPVILGISDLEEAAGRTFIAANRNQAYIDLPVNGRENVNHAVILTGYDTKAEEVTLMDPARSGTGVRVLSYERFEHLWHDEYTGARIALLTKPK